MRPPGRRSRVSRTDFFPLKFVRIEPYVVPKKSLTGDNTERVDTRVLQVIYAIDTTGKRLFVGQQLDVFIDASVGSKKSASCWNIESSNLITVVYTELQFR